MSMLPQGTRALAAGVAFGLAGSVVVLAIRLDTEDHGFVGLVTVVGLALLGCSLALRSQRSLRMVRLFAGGLVAVAALLFGLMTAILTDVFMSDLMSEGVVRSADEVSDQAAWYIAQPMFAAIAATAAVWIADVRVSRLEEAEQQARDDLAAARHAELLLALRSAPAPSPPATPQDGWLKVVLRSMRRRGRARRSDG